MVFDDVVNRNVEFPGLGAVDSVRQQRILCAEILKGVLFEGIEYSFPELKLVYRTQRSTDPVSAQVLSVLNNIAARRLQQ